MILSQKWIGSLLLDALDKFNYGDVIVSYRLLL